MNNKIALFVSLSIFSCSLTSFADVPIEIVVVGQVPTEIVVVGQAPSGSSSSIPSTPTGNTPVPNPTGMNQGPGYADAKNKEAATAAAGKEAERKAKACKLKTAEINAAVSQCKTDASDARKITASACSDLSASATIGGSAVVISGSITISYNPGCRPDADNTMIATQNRCVSDGDKLHLELLKNGTCQ